MTAAEDRVFAANRALGRIAVSIEASEGAARPARVREEGSLRVRFPGAVSDELEAVLVNTAIAIASDPIRMAKAFKKAIEAGREAREIGLAEKLSAAAATSPLTGFLSQ